MTSNHVKTMCSQILKCLCSLNVRQTVDNFQLNTGMTNQALLPTLQKL